MRKTSGEHAVGSRSGAPRLVVLDLRPSSREVAEAVRASLTGTTFVVDDLTEENIHQAHAVIVADTVGHWACERIALHQCSAFPGPVVVVVNQFHAEVAALGFGAGALAWERLPLQHIVIRAQLEALALRLIGPPEPPDVLVRLDPAKFSAVVADRVVQFKPRAFALFTYLLGRREIWTPPQQIMTDVFKTNHSRDSSVVRMQVKNARDALGPELAWILPGEERRGYRVTLNNDSTAGRRLTPHPRYRGTGGGGGGWSRPGVGSGRAFLCENLLWVRAAQIQAFTVSARR